MTTQNFQHNHEQPIANLPVHVRMRPKRPRWRSASGLPLSELDRLGRYRLWEALRDVPVPRDGDDPDLYPPPVNPLLDRYLGG